MNSRTWLAALLCSAGVMALAPAANAQTAQTETAQTADPTAQEPAESTVDDVVVTGSRVIRNGNAMPTPVSVLDAAQLQDLKPGPIAEALSVLPTLSGSRIGTSNPGSGISNAAANALNLRNLGYQRGLVLVDGTRLTPTTFDQIVDITTVPQLLLKRVDVVTGGVSAVYGSDAVSGVVNFITDPNFNGLKFNAQYGIADAGDDETTSFGVAAGTKLFGGRGHIEGSYEYRDDPGIPYRTDRDFGLRRYAMTGAGTTANPYHLIQDARWSNYTFGGLVSSATGTGAALNGMTFDQNGVLSPFVHGIAAGTTGFESGGSGAYHDGSLKALLHTRQVFGRFDYDLTDSVHAYVEAGGTDSHIRSSAQYNVLTNVTLNGQNPFLPAANQFTGTFRLSKFLNQIPRIATDTNGEQFFVVAGIDGSFKGYDWHIAYNHGHAQSVVQNPYNINNQKLAAALDAVRNTSTNQIVCRASLTNAAYANCVPLNLFGPTAASAEALAYIVQPTQFTLDNGIDDVTASIAGSPFSTWAGEVNVALSAEWRRQTFEVVSTGTPQQFADCTSLTTNCTATTALFLDATLANRPEVSNTVGEGAIEFEVPLLKNVPFAENVSFNGAARFTHYTYGGDVWSWKAGLTWQVNDEFKLRGARSQDIRAPTLYDLFQPLSVNYGATVSDLLTGVTGIATTITGGNPDLKPEIGRTWTGGIIWQPGWAPRFSASIDGYYIDIEGAILTASGTAPPVQTTCYQNPTTSAYCSLQVRPNNSYTDTSAGNTATIWYTRTLNISNFKTYGADFEVNYATDLFDRPFKLRSLVTWNPHVVTSTPGSAPVENAGGANVSLAGGPTWASPRVRASISADYQVGPVGIDVQYRWRSKMKNFTTGTPVYAEEFIGTQSYVDLNLKYRFDDAGPLKGGEAFLNVQNLFDTPPQAFAGAANIANTGVYGGFPPGDDAIGRYFTAGVRFQY